MNAFVAIVRRDLLLAARRKSEVLTALFFFMIVVSLFPLGIGPETAMLRRIAPGVLWVAALLAAMLSLGRLFAAGRENQEQVTRAAGWLVTVLLIGIGVIRLV